MRLTHTPVGAVMPYAGPVRDDPDSAAGFPKPGLAVWEVRLKGSGWLFCDGRELPVAKYRELFLAIGFIYGRKKGGFFCLPDYRGRMPRGVNLGALGPDKKLRDPDQDTRRSSGPDGWQGNCVGSVQEDALLKHWHYYDRSVAGGISEKGDPVFSAYDSIPTGPSADLDGKPGDKDRYAARETRGKNVYVHFIIKFTRGFPVRLRDGPLPGF